MRGSLVVLVSLVAAACAPVRQLATGVFRTQPERWAAEVVIHRDAWGVPHVLGPSDAAVMFGAAFAQAEDRFPAVEDAVLRALGRAAERHGRSALADDAVRRAFQVEQLARAEYQAEPAERRLLWQAWAAGLNHYLRVNPSVERHLEHFEPWFAFALSRAADASMVVDGVPLDEVLATATAGRLEADTGGVAHAWRRDLPGTLWAAMPGASAWAVAPARTADGRALLVARDAVGSFVRDQRWEVTLRSEEGWRFTGAVAAGWPLAHAGHNEHLGWAHTAGTADVADAFEVRFDHADDPLLYRWSGGWREAEAWEDTLRVAGPAGPETHVLRFVKTHHGPVVRLDQTGRGVAIRLARHEEGGTLQQRLAMQRAADLNEFWQAHAAMAIPGIGTIYADRAGNILHVPAGAVPRRDAAFDRSSPVDGADPATAWHGYHGIDEMPYLFRPRAGWLRGGSGSPFTATAPGGGPDSAAYPAYMATTREEPRTSWARSVLGADTAWTAATLGAAAFAGRVATDRELLSALVDQWERAGVVDHTRVERVDTALEELRAWDGLVTVESVAATHYILLGERLRAGSAQAGDYPHLMALEEVLTELRDGWGTTVVPWGEVNRLQPPAAAPSRPDGEDAPGYPAVGAPGWTGAAFVFEATRRADGPRRFGRAGHTLVSVTAFGPDGVEGHTVLPFGQSARPGSEHAGDQAALYAAGRFKPRAFTREEVLAGAVESYHPGHRAASGTRDAGETRWEDEA